MEREKIDEIKKMVDVWKNRIDKMASCDLDYVYAMNPSLAVAIIEELLSEIEGHDAKVTNLVQQTSKIIVSYMAGKHYFAATDKIFEARKAIFNGT